MIDFLFNPFLSPQDPPRPQTEVLQSEEDREFERQVFDAVNEYRASIDLMPLIWVPEIASIARPHCQWMCDEDIWEGDECHCGSDDRIREIRELDFNFGIAGENVATAQVSECRYRTQRNRGSLASTILNHWLSSTKGHREQIEDATYTHSGMGVVSCPVYNKEGETGFLVYVTQLFAERGMS